MREEDVRFLRELFEEAFRYMSEEDVELKFARVYGMINSIIMSYEEENGDKPRFEKVSTHKYDNFNLPYRKTKNSAGYDFELIEDVTIQPHEKKLIPTGVKAYIPDGMYLKIVIRSSLGIKQDLRLVLGEAIIDSDYYNNPDNEGEMYLPIINDGEVARTLTKGTRVAQGLFEKYYTTSDDNANGVRTGGIGSTGE